MNDTQRSLHDCGLCAGTGREWFTGRFLIFTWSGTRRCKFCQLPNGGHFTHCIEGEQEKMPTFPQDDFKEYRLLNKPQWKWSHLYIGENHVGFVLDKHRTAFVKWIGSLPDVVFRSSDEIAQAERARIVSLAKSGEFCRCCIYDTTCYCKEVLSDFAEWIDTESDDPQNLEGELSE